MKLLYVTPVPLDLDNVDGIGKKVLNHITALNRYFDVDLIYYFKNKVYLLNTKYDDLSIVGNAKSKLSVLKMATNLIEKEMYEASYIRYPKSDFYFIQLLKSMKKKGVKAVVEIPTFPYDKEGFETARGIIINVLDRCYRVFMKKYVDRLVTYSSDKKIFGIDTINTINGIDFNSVRMDITDIDLEKEISLIAVSGMFRVHGYDRLIEGLHNYYEKGGKRKVVLKLVGDGEYRDKYELLVKKYNLEENVRILGKKFGAELDALYCKNAVGVNSLAIHRQGLENESTLKAKEYVAKGLPIISSSFIDALSEAGNSQFVFRVKPDESPISVNDLIQFVEKVYTERKMHEVREKIRQDGYRSCDIHIVMKPVIEYLLKALGASSH